MGLGLDLWKMAKEEIENNKVREEATISLEEARKKELDRATKSFKKKLKASKEGK